MNKSKTLKLQTVEWKNIPWRKLEKVVFKLQKRIYKASIRGDVRAVRQLQKTLMRSRSAKCLAVRRVTQDNTGKKTAGVDGIKSLSPRQRLELVGNLKLSRKAAPVRRVEIPKLGTTEKRGLGIPTMSDRAIQALVKQALEPEWEALFEPNSYGFRPGRSCHDAIAAIFNAIRQKSKYVLDADIAKCFDCINHEALLNKLNTFPTLRRQIRAWLKAGMMNGKQLFPTSVGTPQGGVISPLLANIALPGRENRIEQIFPKRREIKNGIATYYNAAQLIRYADDFVILHEDINVVTRCQQIIAEWLKDLGLELKPSKTRITHTLNNHEGSVGFDFLSFNIRQYEVTQKQAGQENGKLLGFKTLIKPSQEALKQHTREIGNIINAHKSKPQELLIGKLTPIIKGWANYFSGVVSSKIFAKADHITTKQLLAWAKYTYSGTPVKEIVRKCWQTVGSDHWVFATKASGKITAKLPRHAQTKILRHVQVKSDASPYDGNLVYWSSRRGKHPECPTRIAKILKVQEGKCNYCGLHFREEDLLEIDHILPILQGGKDVYSNLQLLHRHCHDKKTALDAIKLKRQKEVETQRRELDDNPF